MTINPTTAYDHSSAPSPLASPDDMMGRNAFLNLLVTQLQNQDPTQPKADGEFLAQLAQFSTLEQLTQMNEKIDALTAALTPAAQG